MRPVMNGEFPEVCGTCNEFRRYEGTRRNQRIVCGCPQEPRKVSRAGFRAKGARTERAERKKLEALGVQRVRMQPGSGAFGTRENVATLQGDNAFTIAGRTYRQEVKARASDSGFAVIKGWMRDCDVLTIKQDRQPALHVLSEEAWLALVSAANRGGEQ